MAFAYRTGSYANSGAGFSIQSANTATVTLGAALSSGDLIVLAITALGGVSGAITPTFAVSDSINGSWGSREVATVAWTVAGLNCRTSLWAFENSGAGTPVVTMTLTGTVAGSPNYPGGMQVMAFSGIVTSSAKDTSAAATGSSSTASSGAVSPATGAASELMVCCYMDQGEGTTLSAGNIAGSAATLINKHDNDSGFWQGLAEYGSSGSAGGTPAGTVTSSAAPGGWGVVTAVFKLPAAPPTGTIALVLQTPTVAASGSVTGGGASGTAALTLQTPTVAASGTVTISGITGTAALVLQKPSVAASGTGGGTLPQNYYSTTFPLTENPMSEGGVWVQGGTDGLDWQNVRTSAAGKADGTQSGSSSIVYDDSVAVLRGTFGPDQFARSTVFRTATGDYYSEVEILLRYSIGPHTLFGYEVNWSTTDSYCTIVRLDGSPIGSNFTTLATTNPGPVGPGDVVSASIVGSTIRAFINGSQVNTASDATYTTGNPGLGDFLANRGASGNSTTFGQSDFTAVTMPVGIAALVLQGPSVSASGTVAIPVSGTAALTLPRPIVIAFGTVAVPVSGTSVLVLQVPTVVAAGVTVGPLPPPIPVVVLSVGPQAGIAVPTDAPPPAGIAVRGQ